MVGILVGCLIAGAIPVLLVGEGVNKVVSNEQAHDAKTELELIVEEEKKKAKYNLTRQKEIENMLYDFWKIKAILGQEEAFSLMNIKDYETRRHYVLRAVAAKERWTVWRDPSEIPPWDPEWEKFHPDQREIRKRKRQRRREGR